MEPATRAPLLDAAKANVTWRGEALASRVPGVTDELATAVAEPVVVNMVGLPRVVVSALELTVTAMVVPVAGLSARFELWVILAVVDAGSMHAALESVSVTFSVSPVLLAVVQAPVAAHPAKPVPNAMVAEAALEQNPREPTTVTSPPAASAPEADVVKANDSEPGDDPATAWPGKNQCHAKAADDAAVVL